MKLKLLLFYLAIAFAITVINGAEEDSYEADEGEDISSINLVDDEYAPGFSRQARGSVGTRQRYKNHPRPPRRHSQHAPASQNRRYYQDPRYSRQYMDEVDANGYAAVLG